jgi:hypothetical protein
MELSASREPTSYAAPPWLCHYFIEVFMVTIFITVFYICLSKEECRRLEYKNIVRTSQETHCLCTIESSRLMLCKI